MPQLLSASFLIHCARPGIKHVSQYSQGHTDPIAPQWELPNGSYSVSMKFAFYFYFLFFNFLSFFPLLGLLPWHVEVPTLGVELELSLPAYATATWDPSSVCHLHHSSWQCRNLNPLRKARDRTRNLMVPSWIR